MSFTRHSFDYLITAQAQKELTINEAFYILDLFANNSILSSSIASPPENPIEGDIYIIPSEAKQAWEPYSNKLAYWRGEWQFCPPVEGMLFFVRDRKKWILFTDDQWRFV